ncbi:MAG: 30S ribosomal protein S20 [Dehalococcoidia bacterium]
MAHTKSAKKRMRTSQEQRYRNKSLRSRCKTFTSRAETLIEQGDLTQAEEAMKRAFSVLDKTARKRAIHPNNASRHKSRLMKRLNVARSDTSQASN